MCAIAVTRARGILGRRAVAARVSPSLCQSLTLSPFRVLPRRRPSDFRTHDNFFVYGGNGMKNDFGGHDNYHYSNYYAYVGQAIGFYDAPMLPGHEDHFENNTLVLTGTNVGAMTCSGEGKTVLSHNKYYTPDGTITECDMPLEEWQAKGEDKGSTVAKQPDDATIIGWAKALLKF